MAVAHGAQTTNPWIQARALLILKWSRTVGVPHRCKWLQQPRFDEQWTLSLIIAQGQKPYLYSRNFVAQFTDLLCSCAVDDARALYDP